MGPTFIEILHPHDVLVFDTVKITRSFHVLVKSFFADHCEAFRRLNSPSQHGDLVLQIEVLLLFLLHTLHGEHLSRLLLLHHVDL